MGSFTLKVCHFGPQGVTVIYLFLTGKMAVQISPVTEMNLSCSVETVVTPPQLPPTFPAKGSDVSLSASVPTNVALKHCSWMALDERTCGQMFVPVSNKNEN